MDHLSTAMTYIRMLLVVLALPSVLEAQGARTTYSIDNVTVIDVAAGTAVPNQRVVVTGSHITSVGTAASTAAPPDATTIDGQGKFLIPGMWDMHVHVPGPLSNAGRMFGLFLANGITGVRDMGTTVESLLALRSAVTTGASLGPRMVGAGVLIDGAPIVYPGITRLATTPDDVRKGVDSLARAGVNFIKAYEMLRPEVYQALAEQAKKNGLPYAGHLPLMVSAEDAVRAGHKSFEHLRGLEIACSSKADSLRAVAKQMIESGQDQPGMRLRSNIHGTLRPVAYDTYDEGRCSALIRQMAQAGAWQTPNLVLATQGAFRHDTSDFIQRWVKYMPGEMRNTWRRPDPTQAGRGGQPGPPRGANWMMRLTKMLHDGGVRVLPGSDFPNPVMVPGASLHEELVLLVRAGLTTAESLRAATLNPAIYLGMTDSLGTVAAGKVADLVLLDANPLTDIRNVALIRGVWRGGRYLTRDAIDRMLEGFAK
jgi:imidazolonepropionase-like amidohydrolase